jgi:hypothetical protein
LLRKMLWNQIFVTSSQCLCCGCGLWMFSYRERSLFIFCYLCKMPLICDSLLSTFPDRVTGWACEKNPENVAQAAFCQNLYIAFSVKIAAKKFGFFL